VRKQEKNFDKMDCPHSFLEDPLLSCITVSFIYRGSFCPKWWGFKIKNKNPD